MDDEGSDHQPSAEVTPASSENDLLNNKSEDSVDDDDEDDDDIDKMLSELQTFQEASPLFFFLVAKLICYSCRSRKMKSLILYILYITNVGVGLGIDVHVQCTCMCQHISWQMNQTIIKTCIPVGCGILIASSCSQPCHLQLYMCICVCIMT